MILVTHDAKVATRANRVIYLMDGDIYDELILGNSKVMKKQNYLVRK